MKTNKNESKMKNINKTVGILTQGKKPLEGNGMAAISKKDFSDIDIYKNELIYNY